jgi:L-malate glycosyltransferase
LQKEKKTSLNKKIHILHITPHLGGGVGKAIKGIISESEKIDPRFYHEIVCLEKLKKNIFNKSKKNKERISIFANIKKLNKKILNCDILQVEFWNHPLIPWLLTKKLVKNRLSFWCHILGTNYPNIPKKIYTLSDKFFCTSNVTLKRLINNKIKNKLSFISSAGDIQKLKRVRNQNKMKLFYVGTLNFAKLNKKITEYIKAIPEKKLHFDFFGDEINKKYIQKNLKTKNKKITTEFHGYEKNLEKKLNSHNILLYLLNTNHYGTGENALVECMAMGIIPIVLNNPTEKTIVKNLRNGFVIKNISDFVKVYHKLKNNKKLRNLLSKNAIKDSQKKYNYKLAALKFHREYFKMMKREKTLKNFDNIFGQNSFDWFTSFTNLDYKNNERAINKFINKNKDSLNDKTKGSPKHFFKYFQNKDLKNFIKKVSND